MKYRQLDNLYEPDLFQTLKQIQVSHVMFKLMRFVDFGLHLTSFHFLERYIRQLEVQLADIVQNLSMAMNRMSPLCVGVAAHVKVHYKFCTMFSQSHQEILYLKEIFHNMYSGFLDAYTICKRILHW